MSHQGVSIVLSHLVGVGGVQGKSSVIKVDFTTVWNERQIESANFRLILVRLVPEISIFQGGEELLTQFS